MQCTKIFHLILTIQQTESQDLHKKSIENRFSEAFKKKKNNTTTDAVF